MSPIWRGRTPGLELLALFGSRARGDGHPGSDWDFGYLAGPDFDPDDLLARVVLLLGTDDVDLVDLSRASGLLCFRAASEGRPLFESEPDRFEDFCFSSISFWCDMGPIIREAYEGILEDLRAVAHRTAREAEGPDDCALLQELAERI